jgi:two-component system chemotaxis response regulator CheY
MATVLVVDDSAFMRMRNVRALKDDGHAALEAANGIEAVAMYAEHHPDAVVLDITMPGMDGLEALRRIMAMDHWARVAMVTAVGQQQVVLEAIKLGARDFVVKPYQQTRFLQAVHKLLAGKHTE